MTMLALGTARTTSKNSWRIPNAGIAAPRAHARASLMHVQRVREACGEAMQPLQAGMVLRQVRDAQWRRAACLLMSCVQGMPGCSLERSQEVVRRHGRGAGRGGQKQGEGECGTDKLMVSWCSKPRMLPCRCSIFSASKTMLHF